MLQIFVENHPPDIIIGTESWINETYSNSQVFPPNFNAIRGWSVCHAWPILKTWEKNCLLKVISNIYKALLCFMLKSVINSIEIDNWLMWSVTKNRMDKIFLLRTEEIEIGFLTILYLLSGLDRI